MTEIMIDVYGNETEIASFRPGNTELLLKLSSSIDGFLSIGSKSFRITDGKCIFKLQEIEDGEHTPQLFTENGVLLLPKMVKEGKTIYPKPCDDNFIRKLSKRERKLENRVKELEATVSQLMKSVYGTTLFNFKER